MSSDRPYDPNFQGKPTTGWQRYPRQMRDAFIKSPIPPPWARVLNHCLQVWDKDSPYGLAGENLPIRQKDIVAALTMADGHVTRTVHEMQGMGLIEVKNNGRIYPIEDPNLKRAKRTESSQQSLRLQYIEEHEPLLVPRVTALLVESAWWKTEGRRIDKILEAKTPPESRGPQPGPEPDPDSGPESGPWEEFAGPNGPEEEMDGPGAGPLEKSAGPSTHIRNAKKEEKEEKEENTAAAETNGHRKVSECLSMSEEQAAVRSSLTHHFGFVLAENDTIPADLALLAKAQTLSLDELGFWMAEKARAKAKGGYKITSAGAVRDFAKEDLRLWARENAAWLAMARIPAPPEDTPPTPEERIETTLEFLDNFPMHVQYAEYVAELEQLEREHPAAAFRVRVARRAAAAGNTKAEGSTT